MKLQPLSSHRHQVHIGRPLPFGICDEQGRLLLARGQVIETHDQFEGLLERGAFVDRADLEDTEHKIANARTDQLAGLWHISMDQVGRLLRASTAGPEFAAALEISSKPIMALIARDPDLAIFQVVRQEEGVSQQYASRHAVHASIATGLAARRLGWDEAASRCAFRAALTMNISMVDLQNRLSTQVTPLTAMQREQVRTHPERSVAMLEMAGVTDPDWLKAVLQHHETPDGKGYPHGATDISEVARLVHSADVFTAKFSARVTRPAQPPDEAARHLYGSSKNDPMVAALIKEFGLYPPGTAVRLKSGETGMVLKRGESAGTPIVMALTNKSGEQLITPIKRDTSQAGHGIASVLPLSALRVRIGLEQLLKSADS